MRENLWRLRAARLHVGFGKAQRDHAKQFVLVDGAVAVVIVQSKDEFEFVAVVPEDQSTDAVDELIAADQSVAVAIEAFEDAAGEIIAAQPECRLQLGHVDDSVAACELFEGTFESGKEPCIDGGGTGKRSHLRGRLPRTAVQTVINEP